MGVQHFTVAFALILIDLRQRAVVEHAVLTIAALHLQRGVGHCLAAAGIDQRGAVRLCRLGAERVEALPRLPGQNQQR
ncbi:hypothetical protein D3C76_1160930 [compost metagenome]